MDRNKFIIFPLVLFVEKEYDMLTETRLKKHYSCLVHFLSTIPIIGYILSIPLFLFLQIISKFLSFHAHVD